MDTTVDHFTPLALRVRGNNQLTEDGELFQHAHNGWTLVLLTRVQCQKCTGYLYSQARPGLLSDSNLTQQG